MKSRVRIYDGLQQAHTTTVEHNELATDDGLIEMARQKLGLARLALREGEVLDGPERIADGGEPIEGYQSECLDDVERHLKRVLEEAENSEARLHAREALQHIQRDRPEGSR